MMSFVQHRFGHTEQRIDVEGGKRGFGGKWRWSWEYVDGRNNHMKLKGCKMFKSPKYFARMGETQEEIVNQGILPSNLPHPSFLPCKNTRVQEGRGGTEQKIQVEELFLRVKSPLPPHVHSLNSLNLDAKIH